jgi:hypothetical protein
MDLTMLGLVWQQFVIYAPFMVGIILPPFIEVLNKDITNKNEQIIVTLLTCMFVATVLHWSELTEWSLLSFFGNLGIIVGESQVVYSMYFKSSALKSAINDKLNVEEVPLPDRVAV